MRFTTLQQETLENTKILIKTAYQQIIKCFLYDV